MSSGHQHLKVATRPYSDQGYKFKKWNSTKFGVLNKLLSGQRDLGISPQNSPTPPISTSYTNLAALWCCTFPRAELRFKAVQCGKGIAELADAIPR